MLPSLADDIICISCKLKDILCLSTQGLYIRKRLIKEYKKGHQIDQSKMF